MISKKGQGMSLNVIIIAALALIVLVVLVMVFTGRITLFQKSLSDEGNTALVALRVQYSDCHPTASTERQFDSALTQATSVEGKEAAKSAFREEMGQCGTFTRKEDCESSGCKWQ